MGSDPRPGHKNDDEGSSKHSTNNYGEVELKNQDNHYETDILQMKAIGISDFSDKSVYSRYFLASRGGNSTNFGIRYVLGGEIGWDSAVYISTKGEAYGYSPFGDGLRPVFTINTNVKISGGIGTEQDPFNLKL